MVNQLHAMLRTSGGRLICSVLSNNVAPHHTKAGKSFAVSAIISCAAFFLLAFAPVLSTAQDSTAAVAEADSVPYVHSPRKAMWLSAALPGAGQIYNDRPGHRKWWKVPLIYGALGTGVYFIQDNTRQYRDLRSNYKLRVDGDSTTIDNYVDIYSDSQLESEVLRFRRFTELSYIATAAIYVLQIVDATVDAHLYTFDVSNDLSMRIQPTLMASRGRTMPAMSLTIKW